MHVLIIVITALGVAHQALEEINPAGDIILIQGIGDRTSLH